jgi:hypothetical protein
MSGACLRFEEKEDPEEEEGLNFSVVLGPNCPFNSCSTDSQVGVY